MAWLPFQKEINKETKRNPVQASSQRCYTLELDVGVQIPPFLKSFDNQKKILNEENSDMKSKLNKVSFFVSQ